MTKNKRLKIVISSLIANFGLFILGILQGVDLNSLGAGLLMINGPLYAYVLGETYRPSKHENNVE